MDTVEEAFDLYCAVGSAYQELYAEERDVSVSFSLLCFLLFWFLELWGVLPARRSRHH
jgi:hypothetical protein